MDLQNTQLLLDVARRGSFADVARERDVDPSSISRIVAAREAELGFRLFQRTTRKVTLTEAGEIYLSRLQSVIDEVERARDDAIAVSRGPVGQLRMTSTVAYGQHVLVPLLPAFRQAYPQVGIELILSDANLDLVGERIDLAVRLGPGITGDVVVSKLAETGYRVCASPDYLARHRPPRSPGELVDHDCLLFSLPGFRSRWLFRRLSEPDILEIPVHGAILSSGALALRSLALAGLGPVLLGDWMVEEDLATGRLIDLFPDHQVTATSFETAVWMLYPSRSFLPRKVRAMIDFLKSSVGGRRN